MPETAPVLCQGSVSPEGLIAPEQGAVSAELRELLPGLLGPKPVARKLGDGFIGVVPLKRGGWLFRQWATIPAGVTAAFLLTELQSEATTRIEQLSVTRDAPQQDPLIQIGAEAAEMRRGQRLQWFVERLMSEAGWEAAALARLVGGRVTRIWLAGEGASGARDEFRLLAERPQNGAMLVPANATALESLDAALLARRFSAKGLAICPPESDDGYVLFGAGGFPEWVRGAPGMASILAGSPAKGPKRRSYQRGAVAVLVVVAVIWCALPVPIVLTGTARAVATGEEVIALEFGAFLDALDLQPGAQVQKGDVIARLSSPEETAKRADQEASLRLEELNAAAALGRGDYAAMQLAEERAALIRQQLDRIDARLESLTLTAPVTGRITEALTGAARGQFIPAGTTLLRIQADARYDIAIEVVQGDAPLLAEGAHGEVRFRGIANAEIPFTVISRAQPIEDPRSGAISLEARAQLSPDAVPAAVIPGLTGIAQIETASSAPRIYGWLRPAINFLRLKAWTIFDWQI